MSINKIPLYSILAFSLILSSCGGSEAPSKPAANSAASSSNSGNAAPAPASKANALDGEKQAEAPKKDDAQTVAPVVKAYYDALMKKDDAALKKVFSQATLKSFEADMKEEKVTSLYKFITDVEAPPEKPFEVRNEDIKGEIAIAEIKGGAYAVWTKVKFIKENGEWKLTNESPSFEALKNMANSGNIAK